jgi:protein involved in polysaccharide export with SLBB domain
MQRSPLRHSPFLAHASAALRRRLCGAATIAMLFAGLCGSAPVAFAQSQSQQAPQSSGDTTDVVTTNSGGYDTDMNALTGPTRLRDTSGTTSDATDRANQRADETDTARLEPYVPGEFELFVNKLAQQAEQNNPLRAQPEQRSSSNENGRTRGVREPVEKRLAIRRFGSDLITGARGTSPQDFTPQVPPDYLISPGDELVLALWGTVDANLRLVVDRTGRVTIPRVGAVMVAGVRYADLPNVIRQQVAQVFRNFQLSVSLGKLRSIRIYVTGFARRPGSYTVSSLSTIVNALMRTGGPSSAGSFRHIELHRGGQLVTTFDLYDLLLRGDKSGDRVLQAEDVIQIGPVGPQVAMIGSVNKPAIFELKDGDTVTDVLGMAAGFNAVADRTRLAIERLADRENVRVTQLSLPADGSQKPSSGDVLRAFSLVETALPVQRQNKRVRVEGEVAHPGEYILPASSTVNDALRAAGGLTADAYLYGTEFNRESVRQTQQQNYDRALRDMETDFTRTTSTQHVGNADEAAALNSRAAATSRLIEQLRGVRPTGRIVLEMSPDSPSLPDLALEDGDRLYVPPRPTTVGVFGSVVNGGSYLFAQGRSIGDYLRLAGGATRGADEASTFVLRPNGTAVSAQQRSGWFGLGGSLDALPAEPGDTIFLPEQMDRSTFIQSAKDWTQILYQFGLGAAALRTIR